MSPWATRVERDETCAVILFGELGLALQAISDAAAASAGVVVPFPRKDDQ